MHIRLGTIQFKCPRRSATFAQTYVQILNMEFILLSKAVTSKLYIQFHCNGQWAAEQISLTVFTIFHQNLKLKTSTLK